MNRNSFESCFQYQEAASDEKLYRRVKIYNKLLALIQSRSAMASLGMKMQDIFYAELVMERELKETSQDGLSRIEISYYATTIEAEREFFDP